MRASPAPMWESDGLCVSQGSPCWNFGEAPQHTCHEASEGGRGKRGHFNPDGKAEAQLLCMPFRTHWVAAQGKPIEISRAVVPVSSVEEEEEPGSVWQGWGTQVEGERKARGLREGSGTRGWGPLTSAWALGAQASSL